MKTSRLVFRGLVVLTLLLVLVVIIVLIAAERRIAANSLSFAEMISSQSRLNRGAFVETMAYSNGYSVGIREVQRRWPAMGKSLAGKSQAVLDDLVIFGLVSFSAGHADPRVLQTLDSLHEALRIEAERSPDVLPAAAELQNDVPVLFYSLCAQMWNDRFLDVSGSLGMELNWWKRTVVGLMAIFHPSWQWNIAEIANELLPSVGVNFVVGSTGSETRLEVIVGTEMVNRGFSWLREWCDLREDACDTLLPGRVKSLWLNVLPTVLRRQPDFRMKFPVQVNNVGNMVFFQNGESTTREVGDALWDATTYREEWGRAVVRMGAGGLRVGTGVMRMRVLDWVAEVSLMAHGLQSQGEAGFLGKESFWNHVSRFQALLTDRWEGAEERVLLTSEYSGGSASHTLWLPEGTAEGQLLGLRERLEQRTPHASVVEPAETVPGWMLQRVEESPSSLSPFVPWAFWQPG